MSGILQNNILLPDKLMHGKLNLLQPHIAVLAERATVQGLIRAKCFIYYLYFSVDLDVNNMENILLSLDFYTWLKPEK